MALVRRADRKPVCLGAQILERLGVNVLAKEASRRIAEQRRDLATGQRMLFRIIASQGADQFLSMDQAGPKLASGAFLTARERIVKRMGWVGRVSLEPNICRRNLRNGPFDEESRPLSGGKKAVSRLSYLAGIDHFSLDEKL